MPAESRRHIGGGGGGVCVGGGGSEVSPNRKPMREDGEVPVPSFRHAGKKKKEV